MNLTYIEVAFIGFLELMISTIVISLLASCQATLKGVKRMTTRNAKATSTKSRTDSMSGRIHKKSDVSSSSNGRGRASQTGSSMSNKR